MKKIILIALFVLSALPHAYAPPPPPNSNNSGAPLPVAWTIVTALVGISIASKKHKR